MYMLVGPGGNITMQVGDDGVLLVDTGPARVSDKVISTIKSISNKPVRFIINTSVDADHTGGNEAIAKLYDMVRYDRPPTFGGIISTEAVLARMSARNGEDTSPEGGWPSDTYSTTRRNIFFNGEAIQVYHEPAAHTDGDSFVLFRHADVVSAGDVFATTGYPIIDLKRGGSIQGEIDGLNRLVYDMTAGGDKEAPFTLVIPGHGRLCDRADVVFYQEMVVIVRDRVQFMINKGLTLDQIKEEKPTRDYDALYGSTGADAFIEAIYKGLTGEKAKPSKN